MSLLGLHRIGLTVPDMEQGVRRSYSSIAESKTNRP